MKAQIAILVPVWNGLPYIKECVNSVLSQKFTDWEMVISDNSSSDGTRLYLDTLKDSRIRIYKQPENLGIMGNVNFLFSKATAPITQILCADDYFLDENSLSTIVNYWDSAPSEVGLVIYNYSSTTDKKINNAENGVPAVIHPAQSDLWFFICGCLSSNLSTVSMRTKLVEATGSFNEDLPSAGDFEFWTRAARKVSIGLQKERVVNIRIHEDTASNTQNHKAEIYLQVITIYEKLIEELSATYSRPKLIDFFNYEIGALEYRRGIKYALKGNFAYLSQVWRAHSHILWPKWRQLLVCFPIALLNLRHELANPIGEKILNDQLSLHTKTLNALKINKE